ncbi:MAG: hypothetical protein ACFFB2_20755 [Promethearchaeota archaeon]
MVIALDLALKAVYKQPNFQIKESLWEGNDNTSPPYSHPYLKYLKSYQYSMGELSTVDEAQGRSSPKNLF